jgi:hypothetical protein
VTGSQKRGKNKRGISYPKRDPEDKDQFIAEMPILHYIQLEM